MRISFIRLFFFIIAVDVIILFYKYFTKVLDFSPTNAPIKGGGCQHSSEFITNLHDLAFRVHTLLVKLSLNHFLCYGSLWGQIKFSQLPPWEVTVKICALNEEISQIEEPLLYRSFGKNGLTITYVSSDGLYEITDPELKNGKIVVFIFELERKINMYKRIGWKRRMLPPDCQNMKLLDCFPPRLVSLPLPRREFGGYIFPVPREGIEIQKYHYENDWWKDVKPENCW